MLILPEYSHALGLSKDPEYTIIPLYTELFSDFITPIEALRILKNVSSHCYLLESAGQSEFWGRYTFLGFNPSLEITLRNGTMKVGSLKLEQADPIEVLRQILSEYRSPEIEGLPPFSGGLVGYLSFDFFQYSEPKAFLPVKDEEEFNDLDLMLFDKVIAFDHYRQKIILIVNVFARDFETEYNRGVLELKALAKLLKTGAKKEDKTGRLTGEVQAAFDQERFEKMVDKAKEHIVDGDIFQIVLSNRLSAPFEGSLLDTYRVLRTINPSPYMFYLSGTDVELAGASPETLVRLDHGDLYTFPLAGTRKRGADLQEDEELIKDLLQDEKELAEHDMLVDLGRNDLGRVSQFGSVQVSDYHVIQKYSHVMHIASTVKSRLKEDCDALDAISAILPAGTLSGAPKIRACSLISELEGLKRGIYGGAVGYIDFTGNMDFCIAIRLLYARRQKVFIQSGAGIVADSDPQKEYQECLNKAQAALQALRTASEGLYDTAD